MYPNVVFLGMHLYELMIAVGFFGALVYFRVFADRLHLQAGLQNLVIVSALFGIIGGYGSAVLFQAFYNYLSNDVFEIVSNTGATFYGGLIGGAALFLAVYFAGGKWILKNGQATKHFWTVSELAAGGIALAHGVGRIGCLFAGCCHGKPTDAWYGVYNAGLGVKVVPVQLMEALFLFALSAVIGYRIFKDKRGNLGLYLSTYAVWRFLIEYLRTDDRGQSLIRFLSPSQFTAVCLFAVGILVLWLARSRKEGTEHDQT